MNLGSLDVHLVKHYRPQIQRISTDDRPITPLNVRLEADRSPSFSSTLSSPKTVIPCHTTTIPSPRRTIHSEPSVETIRPGKQSIGANAAAYGSETPLVVRFDEEQIRHDEIEARQRERMVELDMTSPPTPIDDTPYIRYAIDALTRDDDFRESQSTSASSSSYPVDRIIPDYGLGYTQVGLSAAEREREALTLIRKHRSTPGPGRLFAFNATRPLSLSENRDAPVNAPRNLPPKLLSDTNIFIPVDPPMNTPRHPDLMFVPTILRPASIITLSCLLLLMVAALMFCAIYSNYHRGLLAWYGGIYGARYFFFSFVPQILAACIFIYIQGLVAAVRRMTPFTMMTTDNATTRGDALYTGLYAQSWLYSKWDGPVALDIANSFFWLSVFTIPLQSCLFSVIMVDGEWRWTTVQGAAWTLVGIYFLMMIAAVMTGFFFFRRTTGLMWDPRSLADMIALLPRSNCLRDYQGTDVMASKEDIRDKLRLRSDRLGYWRTPDMNQGIFYCIGEEGASTRQYTLESGRLHEKTGVDDNSSDIEKAAVIYNTNTRFRYLPWVLRDTFMVFWSVAAFILILALFIVSFLPATAIRYGFDPLVGVLPNAAGFSPANFLYSFVPSLIGMLLYIFYQPLDMAIRKLQPWVEMGHPDGATAERSLLLDYPAQYPIQCTLSALAHGHYRVATTSALSFIFILLPVLAGGIFFPLTIPSGAVRMIPSLGAFYTVLAMLILYFIGILMLIPGRFAMHIPHPVDCLAEIFSFVHSSQMLNDASFSALRTKADLNTRLMAPKKDGSANRYAFGVYRGRNGREFLGIDKLGRRGSQEVMVLSGR